jgi:endonuclease YncB( thermonuclease family)
MLTAKWQGECEALKWDKWSDRIDARLWLPGMAGDVSTVMIQTGWAVPWDGRGAQPKPPWPRAVS